jgi:mRNA interferase HicA
MHLNTQIRTGSGTFVIDKARVSRIVDNISKFVYSSPMTTSKELKRWLAKQGATFEAGKGSHLRVFLKGRQSVLPMHGGEMKTGTVQAIKKQLGLK